MEDAQILLQIAKDLASNTKATENIEKHLSELNGKVAKNVTDIGTLDSSLKLANVAIQQLQDTVERRRQENDKWKWFTIDKLLGLVYLIVSAYILIKLGLQ